MKLEGEGSAVSSPSGFGQSPITKYILVYLQLKILSLVIVKLSFYGHNHVKLEWVVFNFYDIQP